MTDVVDRMHTATIVLDEARSSGDELRLKGYAAVFNSASEDMGFREVIEPGAFADALASTDDLTLLWQHRTDQPLARRSAGNLKIWEDARGLAFEATLPKTQLAHDAITLARSGVVKNMSFAFSMQGGKERIEKRDGEVWRYVSKVGSLYEISLVTEPAYTATSVAVRSREALDAIRARRHARPKVGPYGEESAYSYFRDLATVALADEASALMPGLPGGPRAVSHVLASHPLHGTAEEARNRLAAAESRAASTLSIDIFGVPGPGFLGELFAVAARAKATFIPLLAHEPLPKAMNVTAPKLTSGAAVGYQSQNQPVTTTDPVSANFNPRVVTIAGYVDASQQDVDQTPGHLLDRAIAADLGGAYAQMLEQEVIAGNGAPDRMLGLLALAGTSANVYTDATPTPAELLAAVGSAYAATSLAYGSPIDTIVMHSRRRAWVDTKIGVPFRWPAAVVESNNIPTTQGAGTEDVMLLLARDETFLLTSDLRFEIQAEIGSASLTVRYRVYNYAALLARHVASIGKLNGTGLIAPVF